MRPRLLLLPILLVFVTGALAAAQEPRPLPPRDAQGRPLPPPNGPPLDAQGRPLPPLDAQGRPLPRFDAQGRPLPPPNPPPPRFPPPSDSAALRPAPGPAAAPIAGPGDGADDRYTGGGDAFDDGFGPDPSDDPPAPASSASDAADASDTSSVAAAPTPAQTLPAPAPAPPAPRWPWWLSGGALLMIVLGWRGHRRAQQLQTEAEALARQQRHLRSAHRHLRDQTEQLRQQAVQDSLTGAMNRLAFSQALDALLQHAASYDKPVALFVFDLDHFKQINDGHGHLAGDEALKLLAGIVRENLDSADLFGRFGGDEFLIATMDQDAEAALALGERLRAAVVARSAQAGPGRPALSISVGIARAGGTAGYKREDLFHRADTALYAAKRAGRNRVMFEDKALPPPPEHEPTLRNLA